MEKNSLLAILVCVVFYLGYEHYLRTKYPHRYAKETTSAIITPEHTKTTSSSTSTSTSSSQNAEMKDVVLLTPERLIIENDTSVYKFDQKAGGLASVTLKQYKNDQKDHLLELLEAPLSFFASVTTASRPEMFQAERKDRSLLFSHKSGNWLLSHEIVIDEKGYGAKILYSWKNLGIDSEVTGVASVQGASTFENEKKGSFFLPQGGQNHLAFFSAVEGASQWYELKDHCKNKEKAIVTSGQNQKIDIFGLDKHYFAWALLPQNKKLTYWVQTPGLNLEGKCILDAATSLNYGTIPSGQTATMEFKAWFGPKDRNLMASYDELLTESIDLGFFNKISTLLLIALQFMHSLVNNWGVAIILFTIILKLLFYPLTRQAAISMNRMKKLQPEMNQIREKYKEDVATQQQEIMKFMSKNKVNPMKGCLPILPQIPVFFAFYRVLSSSLELRQAGFMGWIDDLSVQDPYYITPLLLGVMMAIQQKLTPTTGMDKTQERIMMMLPIMFTVMMLTLPSGMVLYMLTNTVISITQQQWLNHRLK